MLIQVLGTGCPKCKELARRTEAAIKDLGLDVPVEKITDLRRIVELGVMVTPALLVNGSVKAQGRIPTAVEITELLRA
jgi:small redox-active disulfide protein 2